MFTFLLQGNNKAHCVLLENMPSPGWSLEIPREWVGGGVLKGKIFKGKYEANPEFLEGWGSNPKTICGGGVWKFSRTSHCDEKLGFIQLTHES